MKISLTKGLDEQETKEVKQEFISSYHLRKQIIKLMEEEISTLNSSMRDLDRYADASWPYYQADRIGQIRACERLISLLSE